VNSIVSEPLAERKGSKAPQAPGAQSSSSARSDGFPHATLPETDTAPLPLPSGVLAPSEFADLYNEHSRAIYYLALRFLSDPQKAEDATHDVFLKAFRKMDQFRGEASWRTWLYRITINHCRNLQQTWHERHLFSNADEAIFDNAPAQTESPLHVLETKELGQRIQKALDGLPAEYRLLLLLVADQELSYEQVGALTEQSADAVRGKLHRARKAFAVLFQKTA
jgi:RNA polymerase sigma-70 factor (ECF subfamily)